MKIVTVIGTRPEIIKMSPLFDLLDKNFDHKIIHSGQHYDPNLDKVIFRELKLKSKIKRLTTGSGNFGEQFAKQIQSIHNAMVKEKPDMVIVQGDTNTALAGALVAARMKVPVIHVEAGCRSGNLHAPEEQNRILIDGISTLRFCPDQKTFNNLRQEGQLKNTSKVGSTTFDAIARSEKLASPKTLKEYGLEADNYVLCTLHRAENMDQLEGFREKIAFLNWISTQIPVLFPIHPKTQRFLKQKKIHLSPFIRQTGPLPHLKFVALLRDCRLVVSDSGGIQEEASHFDRPCLILRKETEWTRLVEAGKNFLFPSIGEKEKDLTKRLIEDDSFYGKVRAKKCRENIPGASLNILKAIKKYAKFD
jgi:UDP-N-acetylglucosamine 2-epimerase